MQFDLLSYQLTEQELAEPAPPPIAAPPINQSAIDWHQSKADYYLRLMGRFMSGTRCRQPVRKHEISRLHELRMSELAAIDRLKGGTA